jgi:hypothetical protein
MKGKKIDTEFLSEFIQECVQAGIDSPEEFANRAKLEVAIIDNAIRELENKKIRRSKLLGVIASFETPVPVKKEEGKLLPFFNISYPEIAREICKELLYVGPARSNPTDPAIIFSFKQLIEYNVIDKSGQYFVRGKAFDDYVKFTGLEV